MTWIDAHAHISFFNSSDIENLINQGRAQSLNFWMMAGYDAKDWSAQRTVKAAHPNEFGAAYGLHPWRVIEMSPDEIDRDMITLETSISDAQAMGETGIDKFKTQDPGIVKRQIEIFERHMELNKISNLPVVLHVVHAESEALTVLAKYSHKGIVHGYSGSYESAKRYVSQGYKISVGRGVFHRGYKNLKDCVEKLPLEHLLLESDAGLDENGLAENPVDIFFKVVDAVAQMKHVSTERLLESQVQNFRQIFG